MIMTTTSSPNALTKDELKAISSLIYQFVAITNDRASKLRDEGKITFHEQLVIANKGRELTNLAGKIQLRILNQILTDVISSKKVIENATKKTEEAIKKINDVIKFLDLLAGLIEIFGEIAKTINAGGGAAAAIKVLIDKLKQKLP
jgi:hypothetical protein